MTAPKIMKSGERAGVLVGMVWLQDSFIRGWLACWNDNRIGD